MNNFAQGVSGWFKSLLGIRRAADDQEALPVNWPKIFSRIMLPAFFIAWCAFLAIRSPVFLTWGNLFNVTRQNAVIGILSLGQLICLLTGNVDISIGMFMGLSGALLAGYSIQFGILPAFIIVLAVTILWGLLNGYLVSRGTGISVIVTLSTMFIARGLLLIFTAGKQIGNFPMPYGFLGDGNLGPVPWSLILFGFIALFTHIILQYTPIGRHLYAVGGNRQAARVVGIKLNKITFGIYLSSAFFSFIAGIVLLSRVATAQATAGAGYEMDSLATVLLGGASVSGGAGSVPGTIIGIFMLGFINNGLNLLGISGYYQYVFKGLIIAVAVIVDHLQHRSD